jgi:hypothetical protein
MGFILGLVAAPPALEGQPRAHRFAERSQEHTIMTRRQFGVRVPWLSRGDPCAVERAADPLNRAGVYSKPGSNLAHA